MLRNTAFNTIGLILYFFSQWLTTVVVVRYGSFETAGVYAAIISYCNMFYYFALYGIRNFQISDIDCKYTEGQYKGTRILCAVCAFLACVCGTFAKYQSKTAIVGCVIYMIFKLGEAYTEGFFSILQFEKRYDIIFVSYAIKAIVPSVVFFAVLYESHELLLALLAMTAGYLFSIVLVDLPYVCRRGRAHMDFRSTFMILQKCTPLLLVSLTVPIMNYTTRSAVEKELGYYALGQYASLSSVIIVLSTMAGAVFLVLIPEISLLWKHNEKERLIKLFGLAILILVIFGIIVLALGSTIGPQFCSLIFGEEILSCIDLLLPLLFSGIILMGKSFFSSILVPLDKRGLLLIGEFAGLLLCALTARLFTRRWGLYGTNYSYMAGLMAQFLLLSFFAVRTVIIGRRREKKNVEQGKPFF